MAKQRYQYDPVTHRYLDTKTGLYLTADQMRAIRDALADAAALELRAHAERVAVAVAVATDPLDDVAKAALLLVFLRDFGATVKRLEAAQFILGRGGLNALTTADLAIIDAVLVEQRIYIERFGQALINGELSAAQAGARAELYAGVGSFERGKAASYGVTLPEYPGDRCLGFDRCRCHWELDDSGDVVDCTWHTVGDNFVCTVCVKNGVDYNPLTLAKPVTVRPDALDVGRVRFKATAGKAAA